MGGKNLYLKIFPVKRTKGKKFKMTDDWVSFTSLLVELLPPLCPRCWNSNNSRPCLVNLIIPRWSPAALCILHKVCQLASGLLSYLCRRNFPRNSRQNLWECRDRVMFPLNSSPKKSIRRQRREVYSHNNLLVYTIQHILWWAERLFWEVGEKQLPSRWWRPR